MGIFRGVCFLTFSDLRHFWWSKGGVQNSDGEEAAGGKRFLNGQMTVVLSFTYALAFLYSALYSVLEIHAPLFLAPVEG